MLRNRFSIAVAAIVALGSSRSAGGAELGALARYLSDDVVAVGYLDLTKVNASAAVDEMARLGVATEGEVTQARAAASAVQESYRELTRRGATRAFAMVRLTDLAHGGPTWVIEVAPNGDAGAVAALFQDWSAAAKENPRLRGPAMIAPVEVATEGGVVLGAASEAQMKLLKSAQVKEVRSAAATALETLLGVDAGVIAFGDPDSRRVLREMFPQLPPPFAEIDGKLIADGVSWAAITLKLPPEPIVGVAVEAANEETSKTLSGAAEKGLAMLKGMIMAASVKGDSEAASLIPVVGLLKPESDGLRLSMTLGDDNEEVVAFQQLLAPALRAARESARRSVRVNNFKQIALAMHIYHDAKKSFPPPAIYDAAGKPLLSWRVMILPYIEQQELYDQFHLDEPWDSDHNRTLIPKMPALFGDPEMPDLAAAGRTTTLLPVGEGTVFDGREGRKYQDITDGTSNTIMIVEVIPELAVVWTKPDDWEVDLADPLRGVKRGANDKRGGIFTAAWCDGSVQVIQSNIDPTALKGMLTRAGEEVISR
jgi:hypothetical protein